MGQGLGQVMMVLQEGGPGRVTEQSLDGESPGSGHKRVLKGLRRATPGGDCLWTDSWDTEQGQWLGSIPWGFPFSFV